MGKGTIFLWKANERVTFPIKNGIQKGKGLDLGAGPPCMKRYQASPLPPLPPTPSTDPKHLFKWLGIQLVFRTVDYTPKLPQLWSNYAFSESLSVYS